MNHETVLEHILARARADGNIRALVLAGSLARDDGTADEYSDLDVELAGNGGLISFSMWRKKYRMGDRPWRPVCRS